MEPLSRDIPRQLIRPRVEEPDCRDTSIISGRYFRGSSRQLEGNTIPVAATGCVVPVGSPLQALPQRLSSLNHWWEGKRVQRVESIVLGPPVVPCLRVFVS